MVETLVEGRVEEVSEQGLLSARDRLVSRPASIGSEAVPLETGLQPLNLGTDREEILYLPAGYRPVRPAPLILILQAAGEIGQGALAPLLPLADRLGLILVAPDAGMQPGNGLRAACEPDVAVLELAIDAVFSSYTIDPSRVAVAGVCDAASHALSLGLERGDLFTHIIAFSPGFMAPAMIRGKPHIFISHEAHDRSPNYVCRHGIVPSLRRAGYDVEYQQFTGPHTVPEAIAARAAEWLTQ